MTDKVLIATSPDDVLVDGFRLLLVDLDSNQTKVLSDTLLSLKLETTVIVYLWAGTDPISWLLDKRA